MLNPTLKINFQNRNAFGGSYQSILIGGRLSEPSNPKGICVFEAGRGK